MNTRSGKNAMPKQENAEHRDEEYESNQKDMMQEMYNMMTRMNTKLDVVETRLVTLEMKKEHFSSPDQSAATKSVKIHDSAEKAQIQSPEANKNNATPQQHDFSFFTAPGSPERFSTPTSVKLTHAAVPGQITIVRGTTTDYTRKLKSITDLHRLINHLLDFDNW